MSGATDPPATMHPPRAELAEPAQTQRPAATTAPIGSAAGATATSVTRSSTKRADGGSSPAPRTSSVAEEPVAWLSVLRLTDASGDVGLTGGPRYADLAGFHIDDDGRRAQLTVTLAGDVPARLAEGEVIGIGIDVFRSQRRESDYQVFLDGGSHGWRAFLQAPRGFVRFPGTFAIADRQMVIELPWSGLGGRSPGRVAVFADWTEGGILGATSQDRAPDTGTRPFTTG